MMLPAPDVLSEFEGGKFALSNLAARRARQLKDGAPPLVRVESSHPLSIALAEIAANKIKAIAAQEDTELAGTEAVADGALEESLTPQLGLLLPALEAEEVEIIKGLDLHEDDHHDDALEAEGGIPTLSDLLSDEGEEPEEPHTDMEDDTLSLSEIAEQENEEADDQDSDV